MKRLNFDVDVIDCEGGEGVDLDILRQKLEADQAHVVKAVCVVHNETSTGVTSDIGEVRQVLDEARHPVLLLVDGVSSVGAIDFRMDEWKVDVDLTGSQKALSLSPPGLESYAQVRKQSKLPNMPNLHAAISTGENI